MCRLVLISLTLVVLSPSAGLTAPSVAKNPTFHDCKLVEHFGRIVHVVYCPKDINPKQIVEFTIATRDIWLKRYGFVQYRVFSTSTGLPKSMNEMLAKSDDWFEKYELASATFNSATGHKDFSCRKSPTSQLSDCRELLK